MKRRALPILAAALGLLAAAAVAAGSEPPVVTTSGGEDPAAQVRAAETAFAATMAARDHAAFSSFLADEAIFVGGGRTLRGKASVAAGWKRYFEAPVASFSWQPETVEVVDSGTLALSSGPVFDPQGKRIGTFNSTWRREPDGRWRIVLDNGCPPCDCGAAGGGTP